MSLLSIDNINVGYGEIQVLFDLSLHVNEGEVVSIIGANGAGKSTLLKTISGMLKPSSGAVSFDGEPIHPLPADEIVDRALIHVPEGRRLFSLMTVQENLEMGAYSKHAAPHAKESLAEVHKLFPRLDERRRQLAGTLSGGEQQMVAIGRGIMARPKILMLDEPSLGLAPVLKKDIFAAIKQIAEDFGTTIVLVEQDVMHSLAISDRAYVMEQGQVVMEGEADKLLHDPHIKKAYLGM
ncbi:ABC transporter ATP-binding protein [Desulfuromonas versatilis]|uniref:ABC transporter ATP-binding protein n=1 Tax=Desulfuromonas versatilis TaxID=2802975 RepID=A0ABN6DXL1_9BACT|nr:ABC transporter ATP-binding protein [Desulfuromonas versatilis]BCR04269.1 ABC transporter ATP-binding protein [Desulfuromonas versatilis]